MSIFTKLWNRFLQRDGQWRSHPGHRGRSLMRRWHNGRWQFRPLTNEEIRSANQDTLWNWMRSRDGSWHPAAGWFGEVNRMRRWHPVTGWEYRAMTEKEGREYMDEMAW